MNHDTIIRNYNDLPLGDYLDILDILKDDSLEEIDREVRIVSILSGRDEDSLLEMPILEYQELASAMGFLLEGLPENPSRLAESYQIGGYDLVPTLDIAKVSTAQYIDFQELHKGGIEKHLPEILLCILIPRGKTYCKGYDLQEIKKALRREMSTFDAITLYGFFIASCKDSIRNMLTSSLREIRTQPESPERMAREEEILAMLIRL